MQRSQKNFLWVGEKGDELVEKEGANLKPTDFQLSPQRFQLHSRSGVSPRKLYM